MVDQCENCVACSTIVIDDPEDSTKKWYYHRLDEDDAVGIYGTGASHIDVYNYAVYYKVYNIMNPNPALKVLLHTGS